MKRYLLGAYGVPYRSENPGELFSRLHRDGWQCTQLAFKKHLTGIGSFSDVTEELVVRTRAAAEENQLRIAVLGTYVELGLLEESGRQAAVSDFLSQISVCRALGAGCIASETTPLFRQPQGSTRQEARKALYRSLETILPEAQRQGVCVALETVWPHTMNTVEAAAQVLQDMESPNLRLIFDPVNLLSGDLLNRQEEVFCRAAETWGDRIAAVHLKGVLPGNGEPEITWLRDPHSVLDLQAIGKALQRLPQQELVLLREEAVPDQAEEDQKCIRDLLCSLDPEI